MSWIIKVTIAASVLAWLPSVLAQTTIPAPGVSNVLVGDFNGDGKQDLLIGQNISSQSGFTLAVLPGKGDGTFSAPVITSNSGASCVTGAADFNGDGKLDLVLCAGGLNLSYIALGNGDGTFRTSQNDLIHLQALVVAVADFNGDGKQDLLTVPGGMDIGDLAGVRILFGNGDGTFTAGTGFLNERGGGRCCCRRCKSGRESRHRDSIGGLSEQWGRHFSKVALEQFGRTPGCRWKSRTRRCEWGRAP